jgi:hypothetical protein
MTRLIGAALFALSLLVFPGAEAQADGCTPVSGSCVKGEDNSLVVSAHSGSPAGSLAGVGENSQAAAPSGASGETPGSFVTTPVCAIGGSQTCAEVATCGDGTTQFFTTFVPLDGTPVPVGTNCGDPAPPGDAVATALPQVTPGMVQRALERVPLPEPDLSVQPPGGRTLINFETNFFTAAQPFTETVTLLGRRVDLDITPSQFRWAFGDGEGLTTTEPGAPYPDLELTHTYLEQGQVRPQVTTVYTADYRVDGGPWQPVPGSVDITSDPVDLTVTEVTNQLVDYR